MPFDANLVLRGVASGGSEVVVGSGDTQSTSLSVNAYGNVVVDLGVHGAVVPLNCVLMFGIVTVTNYTHTLAVVVEHSDHLTDGWSQLFSFDTVYPYSRLLICTTTTAFVSTDIGLALNATTDVSAAATILDFSRELLTLGATGRILVIDQDSGDAYDTAGDILTATSGTGIGLQGAAGGTPILIPHTQVRAFVTPKRYIRGKLTASAGDFGYVRMFVTNQQYTTMNRVQHAQL